MTEASHADRESPSDDPAADTGPEGLLRLAEGLLVVFAAFLVASAITAPLLDGLVSVGLLAEETAVWAATRTALQFLGFALAVVGYLAVTDNWGLIPVRVPSIRETGLIAGTAAGLVVLQYGLLYLLTLAGLSTGQNQATVPVGDPTTYFLALMVVSVLFVGPAEELLFRGVIQERLRDAWGVAPAIAVASLLFGLIHVFAVQGGPAQQLAYAGVATLLGAVLGVAYERTRNVVVPGLAHGLYNATLYAVILATL